jgi:hypothetical protein
MISYLIHQSSFPSPESSGRVPCLAAINWLIEIEYEVVQTDAKATAKYGFEPPSFPLA